MSLLFALAALVTSQEGFEVSPRARNLLAAAVVLFFFAALGGLLANVPRRYEQAGMPALDRLVSPELWAGPLAPAARRTAEVRVKILGRARKVNKLKARAVTSAFAAEVLAVACVAVAVADVLLS